MSPTPEGMNDLEKRLESYTNQAKTSEKEAERLVSQQAVNEWLFTLALNTMFVATATAQI